MVKVQTTLVAGPGFEPNESLLRVKRSLFTEKISLFLCLGN